MKPITAVALRLDCGLPLDLLKDNINPTPDGTLAVLRCTQVQETAWGFLHLQVPAGPGNRELALTVPPHAVAWMLQAEPDAALGFLSGAATAAARCDQAGS